MDERRDSGNSKRYQNGVRTGGIKKIFKVDYTHVASHEKLLDKIDR